MERETLLDPLLDFRGYLYPEYLQAIQTKNIDCINGLKNILKNLNECYREAVFRSFEQLLSTSPITYRHEAITRYFNFNRNVDNLRVFHEFLLNAARTHFRDNWGSYLIESQVNEFYDSLINQSQGIIDYIDDLLGKTDQDLDTALRGYQNFLSRNDIAVPGFQTPGNDPLFFITQNSVNCERDTIITLQDLKDCKTSRLILIYPRFIQNFKTYFQTYDPEIRRMLANNLRVIRDNLRNEVVLRDYNSYVVYREALQTARQNRWAFQIADVVDPGHLTYRNGLIPDIIETDSLINFLDSPANFEPTDQQRLENYLDKIYQRVINPYHATLITPPSEAVQIIPPIPEEF